MTRLIEKEVIGKVVQMRITYCAGCQSCLRMDENDVITQSAHAICIEDTVLYDTGSTEDIAYLMANKKEKR